MAERKTAKRKRAPGGGRKPQGEISQLRSVMSVRLPVEMRDELQKAAKANRKSITQELLGRLQASFIQDRKNHRDPASKALCFLFSELAEYVHHGTPNWRSDPFLFRAYKIGVAKLLDNLPEPPGKLETPRLLKILLERWSKDDPKNETDWVRNEGKRLVRIMKSPEALAKVAVEGTMAEYYKPSQRYKDWEPLREELDAKLGATPDMPPGLFSKYLQYRENMYYGNEQARDALSLKPRGRK